MGKLYKKKRIVFWSVLASIIVIIAIVITVDCYKNPLNGSTYPLIKVSKDDITEVQILLYGKTAIISDPETVESLVELFDCDLSRLSNDYFNYSTGGMEWSLVFYTNHTESERLSFSPSTINTLGEATYKIGHYYYHCSKAIDDSLIYKLWEENLNEEIK